MSNIHTVDELKKKHQQEYQFQGKPRTIAASSQPKTTQNTNQPYEFKGRARRLDGTYVDPEPEPEEKKETKKKEKQKTPNVTPIDDPYIVVQQQVSYDFLSHSLPKELHNDFWSWNLEDGNDISCGNVCLLSYCSCCVGPCCSENRKQDWKQILTKFTLYCMIAQIVMYIITLCNTSSLNWMLEPSVQSVVDYGAISSQRIQHDYELWRVITYMFLHGSWIHLLFNSLAQFSFCLIMEKNWGIIRYVVIYFCTGIIGGLFSSMWSSNKVAVGASCAIFGTMGTYLSLIVIYWTQLQKTAKVSMTVFLVMIPVMFICVSFLPNVDFAGHLGGILGGIAMGFLVFFNKSEQKLKYIFLAVGIVLIIICLAVPLSIIYTR